ncbi:MAG: FAD-dependent oxidoreductase [Patescibacteria group bacterium]
MKKQKDLIIIGGGVMGLMTAYYASKYSKRITLLEKLTIGNKYAASSGLTRSIRNDYLDPTYSRLAYSALLMWKKLLKKSRRNFLIDCGVLNVAKKSITPDIYNSYANKSFLTLKKLGRKVKKFNKLELNRAFPQFDADFAVLDIEAGFLYAPVIMKFLTSELRRKGVKVIENIKISTIKTANKSLTVNTNRGIFTAKKLVITAGNGTNKILNKIKNVKAFQLPITLIKPPKSKYFQPANKISNLFMSEKLPVFAYLDVGIYGHPIYKGKTPGVKIGFFKPGGFTSNPKIKINNQEGFIGQCLPGLQSAKRVKNPDIEKCCYDMTSDNNFIVGKLTNIKNVFVGAGFCGTGFKFAPLIGKVLSELAFNGKTKYDISKLAPERFTF